MDHKEKNYQNLLKQYTLGTISQEDRYLLEKSALDDPFLFEAIEGYQTNKENSIASLAELRKKLSAKKGDNKIKRIPLFKYGIAASIVLLLGCGLWFFNQSMSVEKSLAVTNSVLNEDTNEETEATNNQVGIVKIDEHSNNQYDSPKAIISQQDMAFESTPEISTSEVQNSTTLDVGISPPQVQSPQQPKEETLTTESRASNESIAQKSYAADESADVVSADIAAEEVLLIEEAVTSEAIPTKAKRTSLQASRKVNTNFELSDEDYIPSLVDGILVAPHEGMRIFKANLVSMNNQFYGDSKLEPFNIEVQFIITSEGDLVDIEVTNGNDQDCINRLIAMVKYGGKWVTKPINSEVAVRLKMPCK